MTETGSSCCSQGSGRSGRLDYCERDRSDLYMTVRPPGVERKSSHGNHGQSRKHKEDRGEQGMYNKKYSMDSDYRWCYISNILQYYLSFSREYYRDRPRGEFLTRGAALSSQAQQVNTGQVGTHQPSRTTHEPTYGATRRQPQPHDQHSNYMSGAQAAQAQHVQARLGRNISSEKIGQQERRNPTILRKSRKYSEKQKI